MTERIVALFKKYLAIGAMFALSGIIVFLVGLLARTFAALFLLGWRFYD